MNITGGYTQFPNTIQAAMPLMMAAEERCTRVLVRLTYGYHCQQTRLTYADFQELTGIKSKATISAGLKAVDKRGFFKRTGRRSWWAIGEVYEDGDGKGQEAEKNSRAAASMRCDSQDRHEVRRSSSAARQRGDISQAEIVRRFARMESSLCDLDHTVSGFKQQVAEQNQIISEQLRLISELQRTLSEQSSPDRGANSSIIAPIDRVKGSIIEPNEEINGLAGELFGWSNSSIIEPKVEPNSSNSEPLPLNKEKTPSGKERERGRKKRPQLTAGSSGRVSEKGTCVVIQLEPDISEVPAAEKKARSKIRTDPDTLDLPPAENKGQCKNSTQPDSSGEFLAGKKRDSGMRSDSALPDVQRAENKAHSKLRPHPSAPHARSAEEEELAGHPATAVWLDAGMVWPGWQRLRLIARRMGTEPQADALCKARDMWLLAGYRERNIGGILDWYEAVCFDKAWQPYAKDAGHGRPPPGDDGVPNATMKMLLKMRKERCDGR